MQHRGAKGSEENTGDGAGILIQIPDQFLREECAKLGIELPAPGKYGVGMVSLPSELKSRIACEQLFIAAAERTGLNVLGWRDVPTDNGHLGASAKSVEPVFRQVFIARDEAAAANGRYSGTDGFERQLFLLRKRVENSVRGSEIPQRNYFYVSSQSVNTIIYKGMLSADQIELYFADLANSRVQSALAVVHQRFSTNTFPSWPLAHPFRYVSHNGEINTLLGNKNWMKAREAQFASELFGEDIDDLLPVIVEGGSDSAMLDNALEMLVMCGRSLPHAMMMLIPEAHENHQTMNDEKRAFYRYHACLMEPWDGPASIVFTNGVQIGAVLDRNGLRPSRYYVLKDGLVVMASEVGVLDFPAEDVVQKGRLQPGKMFLIDTARGPHHRGHQGAEAHGSSPRNRIVTGCATI